MSERLLLASGSPRRRQLLESLGLVFEVVAPMVNEMRFPEEEPFDYVERVARAKAEAVAAPELVVLAADTTVVFEGQVFGKPSHPEEAKGMLRRLAGNTHEVLTGVAVVRLGGGTHLGGTHVGEGFWSEVSSTLVRFLPMTEEEIGDYVDGGEPMDKAGAYALGGRAAIYIDWVQGSPSGVVGLPLHVAARLLRMAGFDLSPTRIW
jgi:septum formation protein